MARYLGTEFLQGQGLGNRLFTYISVRSLAIDAGRTFATAGRQWLQADFLDLNLGEEIPDEDLPNWTRYDDIDHRLYLNTAPHDMVHGIYIAGADPVLTNIALQGEIPADSPLAADRVLLYGNLQDQSYFARHKADIRRWLRVKPEYLAQAHTQDDLCLINVRGGEYENKPELYLKRRYWYDAMAAMRRMRPDMRFMVITDDEEHARKLLPDVECHHYSPEMDYVMLHTARYLIISNSSFAFFPAYTSVSCERVIAPKYWARHNVSTGYWASEQNIYDGIEYMGRDGRLYTAAQCRVELARWQVLHQRELETTRPWAENDPQIERVRKRNERERLMQKAVAKLGRTLTAEQE